MVQLLRAIMLILLSSMMVGCVPSSGPDSSNDFAQMSQTQTPGMDYMYRASEAPPVIPANVHR